MTGEAATSEPGAAEQAARADRRQFWLFVALSFVVAAAVLIGLRVGVGVELDAPTWALALTCVVLIWTLRAMWGVVTALARPPVESLLAEVELGARGSTLAELRDEKRRVLRAIKELEFDHAMGKLSNEDYDEVGSRYKLRAIEVMRLLDDGDELHPDLAAHLAAVGVEGQRSPSSAAPAGQGAEA